MLLPYEVWLCVLLCVILAPSENGCLKISVCVCTTVPLLIMENCHRNRLDVTTCFWRWNNRHNSVLSVFQNPQWRVIFCGNESGTSPANVTLCHNIMPHLVSDKQNKQNIVNVSQTLPGKAETLTVSFKVIKGDGTWVYRYDPATKKQSSRGNSPSAPRLEKLDRLFQCDQYTDYSVWQAWNCAP